MDIRTIEVFTDLNMQVLTERLLIARKRKGLTQVRLALYAEMNPTHYNELERGKNAGLRAQTLYRLCQVLDVSADYLLGLTHGQNCP